MASHFCSSRLRRCVPGNRGTEKSETAAMVARNRTNMYVGHNAPQIASTTPQHAIQAELHGARAAANMYPPSNQIHCQHAPGNEGWRCFVRGGPCHTI